jgi:two-component system CheB/CheR fusion protein
VLKDEFLAVMSHELKHPLNLINVNAEMLSRLPEVRDAPAAARATEMIRRTVQTQARIIDDLLDLSRMHTGKLALNPETMALAPLVERLVEAAQNDAQRQGIGLTTRLDESASLIHADPVRVEQIVLNLLSNALKFTPAGGTIELSLEADGPLARLDVRDSGEGLEPKQAARVFEMFSQGVRRASTRRQGGLGIGLALVKHLAKQQGGKVGVASAGPGRGACFSVWLPLAGVPGAHPGASVAPPRGLAGLSVLLVDDTLDTLESFGMLLELEGARVTTAPSGQHAHEAAAAAREGFDLILSDVAMPDMDGLELMRRLRRMERCADVPAIALTGFGRASDAARAIEAGFDTHLSKPVGLETLIHAVMRLRQARGG